MSARSVAFWLLAIVGMAYYPSLHAPYQFDDGHSVASNPAIRSFSNIPKFFVDSSTSSTLPGNQVYRPITYVFYTFLYAIGGGSVVPFHLFKILIHAFCAFAFYLIWLRWFSLPGFYSKDWFGSRLRLPFTQYEFKLDEKGVAFFAAVLFAVHPALSENVIYISATTSLLAATFFLAAYLAYWEWREQGDWRLLGASLLGYFLSVGSKEEGITLVAVIALTEWYRNSAVTNGLERARRIAPTLLPFALFGMLLFALAVGMNPRELNFHNREVVEPWQYFITQLRAWVWYLKVMVWPFGLNADNVAFGFSTSLSDVRVWEASLMLSAVGLSAFFLRNRFPMLLFACLWFVITISPSSSFVALAEPVNEHRMYLPYVAMVMPAFIGFLVLSLRVSQSTGADTSRRVGWVYGVVLVLFVVGTEIRNKVWADPELLWQDTLEKNPNSGRAMNNLAQVYMGRAEWPKAEGYLKNCNEVWPNYPQCHFNIGITYARQAKWNLAEKSLLRANQLNPAQPWTFLELAKVYEGQGATDRAIESYNQALALSGQSSMTEASMRLARLQMLEKGVAPEAVDVQINTDDEFEQWFSSANTDLATGRTDVAIKVYRFLVQVRPDHVGAQYNLGVGYLAKGETLKAIERFRRTVELDPKSEPGLINLAFAAAKVGDRAQQLQALQALIRYYPNKPEYRERFEAASARRPSGEGSE